MQIKRSEIAGARQCNHAMPRVLHLHTFIQNASEFCRICWLVRKKWHWPLRTRHRSL